MYTITQFVLSGPVKIFYACSATHNMTFMLGGTYFKVYSS